MCGVIGIYSNNSVFAELYEGLLAIQHRGQDSGGIITYDGALPHQEGERPRPRHLHARARQAPDGRHRLSATCAIRRSGAGGARTRSRSRSLRRSASRWRTTATWRTTTSSRRALREIAPAALFGLRRRGHPERFRRGDRRPEGRSARAGDVYAAVASVYKTVLGSYTVVGFIAGHGLFAFRDPYGIKPIVFGRRRDGIGRPTPWPRRACRSTIDYGEIRTSPRARRCSSTRTGDVHMKRIARSPTPPASSSSCTSRGPIRSSTRSTSTGAGSASGSSWPRRSGNRARRSTSSSRSPTRRGTRRSRWRGSST